MAEKMQDTRVEQRYVCVVRGFTKRGNLSDVRHYSAHTTTEAGELAVRDGLIPHEITRVKPTNEYFGKRIIP
jgi:hypothetical protein